MRVLTIDECPQGSPEWWEAKRGIPSASNFDRIMVPVGKQCCLIAGHDGEHQLAQEPEEGQPKPKLPRGKLRCQAKVQYLSAQAEGYIDELIGDLAGFDPPWLSESRTKPPTKQTAYGLEMEAEARRFYAMTRKAKPYCVGVCITDDGRFCASPDALVDPDGCVEIKCPERKTHVGYLRHGRLPDEYKCQVHGQLVVTGRAWVDFLSYVPGGLPPLLIRVEPDEFTGKLAAALDEFWTLYQATRARVFGEEQEAPQ